MSAFLGNIHYWLYNKILLQEKLLQDIEALAKKKGFDPKNVVEESYNLYGAPVTGPLENVIEHTNIHGWLQQQIISVESRLAFVATELTKGNIVEPIEIANLFYHEGVNNRQELGDIQGSPQDYFKLIFDYLLEGMPCDHVNKVILNTENNIVWETTRDLHIDFWDNVDGDINQYYYYRNAWINGFLSSDCITYEYRRDEANVNEIRKV